MGDWIYCNYCSSRPGSNKCGKFFLASCGEILCQKCFNENADSVCKICKHPLQVVEINRQLKPELQMFFLDPKEVLKRQSKQFLQIMEFQAKHRDREQKLNQEQLKKASKILGHFKQEIAKKAETEKNYGCLKDEYKRLYSEHKKMQNQFSQLVQEHKNLMEQVERTKKADQFTSLATAGNEADFDSRQMFQNLCRQGGFPDSTPHNPITTSTPKNQVLSAGRISMALKGTRNSGSGNGTYRTPTRHSPALSITTPVMLGIQRQEASTKCGNPYDGVWQGQNGSPIHISPRTVARSEVTKEQARIRTYPTSGSVQQPPIRLPFTMNKNTLS